MKSKQNYENGIKIYLLVDIIMAIILIPIWWVLIFYMNFLALSLAYFPILLCFITEYYVLSGSIYRNKLEKLPEVRLKEAYVFIMEMTVMVFLGIIISTTRFYLT